MEAPEDVLGERATLLLEPLGANPARALPPAREVPVRFLLGQRPHLPREVGRVPARGADADHAAPRPLAGGAPDRLPQLGPAPLDQLVQAHPVRALAPARADVRGFDSQHVAARGLEAVGVHVHRDGVARLPGRRAGPRVQLAHVPAPDELVPYVREQQASLVSVCGVGEQHLALAGEQLDHGFGARVTGLAMTSRPF